MTDAFAQSLIDQAGLTGWRAAVRRGPHGRSWVAVLTSPDFDPARGLGRMVTARAAWATRATFDAIAAARGPQ